MTTDNTTNTSVPLWLLSGQAFCAGWISGAAGVMAGHPFDTVKTLQQTQLTSKTSIRMVPLLKSILKQHGWRSLYKGVTYPLLSNGVVYATFFAAAEFTRNVLIQQGYADDSGKLTYGQLFFTGCVGGVAQLSIVSPTELVKIKLQDQLNIGKKHYKGSIDCTIQMIKKHGMYNTFTRGLLACSLREPISMGIYIVSFEYIKDTMTSYGCQYIVSELMAGGAAGFAAWAVATPADVVKSRIQASEQKQRIIPVVKSLYAEEGVKAFTRGFWANSLRGFPTHAITLFGFSEIMRWINAFNSSYYG